MADWLDTGEPETARLPVVVAIPVEFPARVALVEACWSRLSLPQKTFLTAWRENRFNARKAAQALGLSANTKPMTRWMEEPDFATVAQVWRGSAAQDALDKDRLLARQDDIVETLLTPKPILHQGVPTGFYEVEAGAASRANEVLLDRAMPKPRADVEVNVGVVYAPPTVEVEASPGTVIDATSVVEAGPILPEEDWL